MQRRGAKPWGIDVATLYQRVLGNRFADLHPVLRRFHSCPTGGTGAGRFAVIRYPGLLRRFLAFVLRLPSPGRDIATTLEVTATSTGERWVRTFGRTTLVTRQTVAGGLLIEYAGPMSFGLVVEVVAGGMVMRTRHVWCLGLPLFRCVAPSVEATVVPAEQGWSVVVRLVLPLIGPLMEYRGDVVPRWT